MLLCFPDNIRHKAFGSLIALSGKTHPISSFPEFERIAGGSK
jgi:hypothetical protein